MGIRLAAVIKAAHLRELAAEFDRKADKMRAECRCIPCQRAIVLCVSTALEYRTRAIKLLQSTTPAGLDEPAAEVAA